MNVTNPFRFLFLVIVFIQITQTAIGQFREIYKDSNPENYIQNLSFFSANEGYIAFRDHIAFTQDSGHTLTPKPIHATNINYNGYSVNLTFGFAINGVKAFDRNNLLVYGHYGFVPAILRSTNGGNNYTLVEQSMSAPNQFNKGFTDMAFPENDEIGYVIDADRILKTTNKGISWSPIYINAGAELEYLDAANKNTLFALSTAYQKNKIIRTIDGGHTWNPVELPGIKDGVMTYANFLSELTGWLSMVVENNAELIYKTTDGGSSWVQMNDPIATAFSSYKIKFVSEDTGYAIKAYTIFKTTDSGKTWESLPRDNDFNIQSGRHRNLQIMNENLIWAGGEHGFLELSSNAGGTPLPSAYFKTDTTGVSSTGIIRLINYSKPGYSYQWMVNNILISDSYNSAYTHDPLKEKDTITLIVSNGQMSDTAVLYQTINPPVIIYDFNPKIAISGTEITITGNYFHNITSVKFGDVEASAFYAVSSTEIRAIVHYAISGSVTVTTEHGVGIKPGFTFYEELKTDLPLSLNDSILCKSEIVRLTIKNTEPLVRYTLTDYDLNTYASVESKGGTIDLVTTPISKSGNYQLKASRMDIESEIVFPYPIFINVEHPKADFESEIINLQIGESTSFKNRSYDASNFQWIFYDNASISGSTDSSPKGISYSTPGQKTLTLISKSSNGCIDTMTGNAVFVYPKPTEPDNCFGLTVTDSTLSYQPEEFMQMNKVLVAANGDFYLSGRGNKPELKSRYGNRKKFKTDNLAYFAKYTASGALKWVIYMPGSGNINEAEKDEQGNIYIVGHCDKELYLHFPKGDSLLVGLPSNINNTHKEKVNGFILKIDSNGNYLWHGVLEDPSPTFQGTQLMGGFPGRIKINSDKILISGICLANLSYFHNTSSTQLLNINNSSYGNNNQNSFVVAVDTSGTYLWHIYMEGASTNQLQEVSSLNMDQNGNSLIAGHYEEGVSITDGAKKNVTLTGQNGTISSYMLKVNNKGNLLWKIILKNFQDFRRIQVQDIVTDTLGNSYITGSSSTTGISGSYSLIDSNEDTTKINHGGFFLAKINLDGNLVWEAGTKASYYGGGNSIVLRDTSLFITGYLSGNDHTPTLMQISSTDNHAIQRLFEPSGFFILQYDTAGKIQRINYSGSDPNTYVRPNKLVFDQNNNFLITASNLNTQGLSSYFNINQESNSRDGIFLKLNRNLCMNASTATPVNAGQDKTICAGDSISIGSSTDSQSRYFWTTIPVGFTSEKPQPIVKPDTTTKFLLTVTLSDGYILKDSVTIYVNKPITEAGMDTTICEGTQLSIGSIAVAGQTYHWTSDPTGFNSTASQPVIQPKISTNYILTVSGTGGCQYRDSVRVNVRPILEPTVTITTDSTDICFGTSALFTAIATNAGDNPLYQWTINGINVGTDSDVLETTDLKNGDQIALILTSKEICSSPTIVNSNEIQMNVYQIPELTISGNAEVAKGQSVELKAEVMNAANISQGFQWQDSTSSNGWQNINEATNSTLNYTPLNNGDKIRCVLTNDLPCLGANQLISNSLMFTVKITVGIDPVPVLAKNLRFYPNPVTTILTIDSIPIVDQWETLEIFELSGKKIKNSISIFRKTQINIDLTQQQPGVYVAILRRKSGSPVYFRFIKL